MVGKAELTAIEIDASGARRGAEEIARAKDRIKQAGREMEVVSDRVQKALDAEEARLNRLRRQIDPTYDALKKFAHGQALVSEAFRRGRIEEAEQIRLLEQLRQKYKDVADAALSVANTNVPEVPSAIQQRIAQTVGIREPSGAEDVARRQADYEAWGREVERLGTKFDPLFAQTRRYQTALDELNQAHEMGVLRGDAFARALARVMDELSPAAISARDATRAQRELSAQQEEAARAAEAQARAIDDLVIRFTPVLAQTRRYEEALRELQSVQAHMPMADYAAAWEKIERELNPASIATRELAREQEWLRQEAEKVRREAEAQAQALDSLRQKYDPTYAATKRYYTALKDLTDLQREGAISSTAFARGLERIERELNPAAIAARQMADAQRKLADDAWRFMGTLDPAIAAQQAYNDTVREADRLLSRRAITEEQHALALSRSREALERITQAQSRATTGRMSLYQATQLSYQINDIFSQAATGTNPLIIAAQQGPQITQIFGGLGATLRAIPPVAFAVTAAIATIVIPSVLVARRMSEIGDQTRRLDAVARSLNPQLQGMAQRMRELTLDTAARGVSRQDAIAAIDALSQLRTLRVDFYRDLSGLAVDISAARGGGDAASWATKLGQAFTKGAAGVRELDAELGFLRPSELEQIRLLDEQGRRADALAVAIDALNRQFSGRARAMKSAWGQAMDDMRDAYDRLLDRIATSDLATVVARIASGIARGISGALDSGQPTPGQPYVLPPGGVIVPVPPAAAPPDPGAADRIKRIQEATAAYDKETAALRGLVWQRQIHIARLQAEQQARAQGRGATEVAAMGDLAEAAARRDLSLAIEDENRLRDLNIRHTIETGLAHADSAAEALRAAAAHGAAADYIQTGADAAARATRILRQGAADAFRDGAADLAKLRTEVANLNTLTGAAGQGGSPAQEGAIRRRLEAEDAYRERIAAASAANDTALLDLLLEQRAAYEHLLTLRDSYNQSIASAADRRGLENDLSLLSAERAMIIATNAQRQREIMLLQLRQRLIQQGYQEGTDAYRQQYDQMAKLIDLQVRLNDEIDRQTRAYNRFKDTMLSTADALNTAFEDLVFRGESFEDVLNNLSQALLRLGQDVLVLQPLRDWLSGSMDSSRGGGGIWGTLTQVGTAVMSGWNAISGGGATSGVTTATSGGFGGAPVIPVTSVPLAHSGWRVGEEPPPARKTVPTHIFVNAPRLHNGLEADEFPAVLQRGERVLPRGRSAGGSPTVVMNITTPDANSFRASQAQVSATAARALGIAQRRNG